MTAIADTANGGLKRSAKLIDNTVFDAFKTLTSEAETERIGGSLSLLRHLDRSQNDTEKVTYKPTKTRTHARPRSLYLSLPL